MEKYTNKNKFFGEIIDEKLKDSIKKDDNNAVNNYLCDIDYVYRFNYGKCSIVSQIKRGDILGNKWLQYKNFVEWCKKNKKEVPDYIPETHLIIKNDLNEKKLRDLFKNNKKWIVKPENASFRAGIHVVNNYEGLIDWLNKYINNKWILQDYIDDPLKIDNKKMHFTLTVLELISPKYNLKSSVINISYPNNL